MADWNIDLMKHQSHDKTGEFLDIMFSRSFFPLISRPTRITSNSATLIDNICTNDPNNCSASGLLFTDISDHLPIFTILSDHCKNTSKNIYINVDDKEISGPTQIADHFCAYFTNIGPNLANSIPPCLTSHRPFLSGAFLNSLYLQPTIEQEIIEICASFRAPHCYERN